MSKDTTVIGGVLWECREVRVDVGGFGVLSEEINRVCRGGCC